MNKAELIEAISNETNCQKKDIDTVLNAYVNVVTNTLKKGEKIQLVGFGTYEVLNRSARIGRNPSTGEEMKIPAARIPKFKAGKRLKDAVNK